MQIYIHVVKTLGVEYGWSRKQGEGSERSNRKEQTRHRITFRAKNDNNSGTERVLARGSGIVDPVKTEECEKSAKRRDGTNDQK